MPTVCLIIAECSALNTCGIIVIYTALALSVSSTRHTQCAQGVHPAADDVCSTFSIWCQLWFVFAKCSAISPFKVRPVSVRFGICSTAYAHTSQLSVLCSVFWFLWCDQCSQHTAGAERGAQCQCMCSARGGLSLGACSGVPTACSCCPHTPARSCRCEHMPSVLLTRSVLSKCSP